MRLSLRPCAPLVLALLALGAGASTAAAQPPSGATVDLPGVFSEVLDVRVVEVQVVVTDGAGRRVPGLGREDFRLTVDGEARTLDFFEEIRDGEPAAAPLAGSAGGAEAQARADASAGAGADAILEQSLRQARSTSHLVFIDDSFLLARDRNLVLERLARDLDRLDPRDRMAVVAFDGRELELLSAWTGSRRVLAGALRDARARPAGGAERERERRLVEISRGGGTGSRLSGIEHRYARLVGLQVERSVMAAAASLRAFPSPPGRRVMLLLAGAWPLSPAEFAATGAYGDEALEEAYASGVLGYEELYRPLVDTANLLGYTLYPVDVPGTAGRIDPEVPLGVLGGGGDRSFVGPEGNVHAGMRLLAERTGGLAVVNEEREQAFAAVAADLGSYYTLGFRLERAGDDARHAIAVEALRPGLATRAREGFVDLSRGAEMTLMTASALLFGNPASPLAAQLRFGLPQRVSRGRVRLRVEVGFPLDQIALEPAGAGWRGEVAIRLQAMDDEGRRIEPLLDSAEITLGQAPEPGELHWHSSELELARRWHRLVAGVFDRRSGRIWSSAAEISP